MRKIQSFVRRSGRLTPSQKNGLTTLWHSHGIDKPDGILDFYNIFGNNQPVILEIGFGNGDSLLQTAQDNPTHNYLGIEVYEAGVGRLIAGISRLGLDNIKILKEDAIDIIEHHIDECSLAGVQIFFPDPWHKKKHHKRRLIQPYFLSLLAKKLDDNGFLHIATDWEDYAQEIDLYLNQHLDFKNSIGDTMLISRPKHRPLTKFESRGLHLKHGIWDFYANKQLNL